MPEPPCPMQIFFSGARKEEFSLPFSCLSTNFTFRLLRSEDQCSLPKEEKFCSKFFVLFLLQYIYRRQKLNNKYFSENYFKKIFIQCVYFFYAKKRPEPSLRSFSFCIFSSFPRKSYLRRERTPCGCWLA